MEMRKCLQTSEQEEILLRILREILNTDCVEVTADLFEMGLSSLGALSLIADAEKNGLIIDLVDIVEQRTVRGIIEAIAGRQSAPAEEDYALSEARERKVVRPAPDLWFKYENPGDIHFPELYSFGVSIDAEKLCDALNRVVANRSALSMILERNDTGEVFMRYDPTLTPHFYVERLTEAEFEAKLADLIHTFVMYGAPLIHAGVYKTERRVYLFVDIHHMFMDDISMNMLFDDIEKAYHNEPLGQDTYCTYCAQLESERSTERYREAKDTWKKIFYDEDYHYGFSPDQSSDESNMAYLQCPRVITRTELSSLVDRFGVSKGLLCIGLGMLTMARVEGEGKYICTSAFNNRKDSVSYNAFGWLTTSISVSAKVIKSSRISEFFKELMTNWIENAANITANIDAQVELGLPILQVNLTTYEDNNREVMSSLGAKHEDTLKLTTGVPTGHILLFNEMKDMIVPILFTDTTLYSSEKQSRIFDALETVIDRIISVKDPDTATLDELLN